MIKSERSPAIPPTPHPACFVERDSPTGISFETQSGRKRFALNAFLSAVDYAGAGELVFRYTFCTVTVRGQALDPIWNAVCTASLARIIACSNGRQSQDGPTVSSITIEDRGDAPEVPPFSPGGG